MASTRGTTQGTTQGSAVRGAGTGGVSGDTTAATASVTMGATQLQTLLQVVRPPQPSQPVPEPSQVAQPQCPTFALTLGQANAIRFIDYTTATGINF